MSLEELTALASEEGRQRILNEALRFMVDRDEILLDVEKQAIHSRRLVTRSITSSLEEAAPQTIRDLALAAGVGFATCCDALGWMQRDGRVLVRSDDLVELVS